MGNLPLNIDFQQILLHLFNFALLFGGLYFILYRPVKNIMDKREEEYRRAEEESKKLSEDARAEKEEAEKKLAALSEEGAKILSDARKEAEAEREKILADARREGEKMLARSREAAQREREDVLSGINGEIRTLAENAARKIVMESEEEAVDTFLSGVEEKGEHHE